MKKLVVALTCMLSSTMAAASTWIGKQVPAIELQNQDGKLINIANRKGVGPTVLFFYPKAGTPGCTKQACAFRDSIKVIRDKGAEVYGISMDSVASQKKFHDEHKMTFDLLADEKGTVTNAFNLKMFGLDMAKRQTFILDQNLVIREHFEDVDPAIDAKNVAKAIEEGLNKKWK